MMKRVITGILTAAMITTLTACGGTGKASDAPAETASAVPEEAETDASEESETDASKEAETDASKESETDAIADSESVNCFIDKAEELAGAGTADSFALIDIDADGTPELAAADSAGEQREEGNAFLFIEGNGEATELLSVNSGYDGAHIYVSVGKNTMLETGGMVGNEFYTIYAISGSKLEKTREMKALCDPETDEYTYYDGETEITAEQFADEFAKAISESAPYTAIDCDGLNEVNITFKDGNVEYEKVSTQKYMSIDELKEKLK